MGDAIEGQILREDKRGGHVLRLTLDDAVSYLQATSGDGIAELGFLAGLTIEDTSEVPGISPATIKRDWVTAGGWWFRAMSGEARA